MAQNIRIRGQNVSNGAYIQINISMIYKHVKTQDFSTKKSGCCNIRFGSECITMNVRFWRQRILDKYARDGLELSEQQRACRGVEGEMTRALVSSPHPRHLPSLLAHTACFTTTRRHSLPSRVQLTLQRLLLLGCHRRNPFDYIRLGWLWLPFLQISLYFSSLLLLSSPSPLIHYVCLCTRGCCLPAHPPPLLTIVRLLSTPFRPRPCTAVYRYFASSHNMSVDVFGRVLNDKQKHSRGVPGIGYKLTEDGLDFDIEDRRLCNVGAPADARDAINFETLYFNINSISEANEKVKINSKLK
ncbi:unnamed protein product [Trichogramma brassicae]|uniref:Uncharacterized protein n=1 Tax=Trichogramma brassicae TaxID=86971 RepID=A0A6H5ILC6_9HYME|nr:unnamed protein product [Trichogramma brassicae]